MWHGLGSLVFMMSSPISSTLALTCFKQHMQIYMCCIFRHLSALFQEVVTRSQYFPARPTKFVGNVKELKEKCFLLQILHFPKMGKIMVHARHWKTYCTFVHCDIIRFAKKNLIQFREAFKEAEGTTYEVAAFRQLFWCTDFKFS